MSYSSDHAEDGDQELQLDEIADSDYGIPTYCPCGGKIVMENPNESSPFLYGMRYFVCNVYKDDGLHRRTRWDKAIEEEVEKLTKKIENQAEVILRQSRELEDLKCVVNKLVDDVSKNGSV